MFRNEDVQAWSDMMSQIYPAGLAIMARDDVVQLLALTHWRLYQGLIAQGFTDAQALAIVAGSRQAPHISMDGHSL